MLAASKLNHSQITGTQLPLEYTQFSLFEWVRGTRKTIDMFESHEPTHTYLSLEHRNKIVHTDFIHSICCTKE